MATAYIYNGDKVLMIKKSSSRLYNSEFWSGLGGHLEPNELNSPRTACLREIFEESGIEESELSELRLRYILIRTKESEIRQQYVYFGKTMKQQLITSHEGELYWLDVNEMMTKHISRINREMLEHYLLHKDDQTIYVGVISVDEDQEPFMQWSELRDPKIF
jgi:ADP-ribose pyrophosphatase